MKKREGLYSDPIGKRGTSCLQNSDHVPKGMKNEAKSDHMPYCPFATEGAKMSMTLNACKTVFPLYISFQPTDLCCLRRLATRSDFAEFAIYKLQPIHNR
jgi:hypothetical protein